MNHTHHRLYHHHHHCLTQLGSKILSDPWQVEWREKHRHHHPSYPLHSYSKILSIPWFTHTSYPVQTSEKISPTFFALVLTLLCLHICRLLRKLTLLCDVLILPLLFRLCRNFALHFGVLILPLLYNIC